ncbi:hypothetical protein MUK42_08045 [Musa troglodytarum]|uniref:SNRNP25 ubiquitin-like domain-containing protein n=1 Tax=Musa troglodytarum TaxID=320322 RepID=A0A9E7GVI7_9LILI|nr:hypothetical protein MUK42_08045 [Musa troglodytarum]
MPSDAACCVRLLQPSASAIHVDAASPFADGSFSYIRLPADPLLRLSVLKLDGSSFDVQVTRTARVRELKEAVECLFSRPSKDASSSWSHVWGHFCLCYYEHRLTDDKAYLRNFGIKDGDQLHFIRHLSFDHRPGKGRRPINHRTDMEQHRMSFTGSKVRDEVEENDKDRDHNGVGSTEFVDEQNDLDDNDNRIRCTEFKFGHRFRGWFSYSRLRTSQRTKSMCRFVPNFAESPKVGSKRRW